MSRHTSLLITQHQQIQLLLPWYLNQSLEQNERLQVQRHLRSCLRCNRELVALRKLVAAVNQPSDLEVAAEASFAGLHAKMQAAEPVRQSPTSAIKKPTLAWFGNRVSVASGCAGNTANRHGLLSRLNGSTGKRFAIAASMLLVMVTLTMHYGRSPVTADYYTLSAAKTKAPEGVKLRVVFSKSLPESGINSLLEKIHGRFVEGPNSVGAYTVRLADGKGRPDITEVTAFLRNQQNVLLVEPVIEP